MDTHGGAMPVEPLGKKIGRILTCKPNPYKRFMDEELTLTIKKKQKGPGKRVKAKKDRDQYENPAVADM